MFAGSMTVHTMLEIGVFLGALALCSTASRPEYVELDTPVGRLRGVRETIQGTQLDTFLGIPFAKPPVGNRRFKRPEASDPWEGILDATNQPPSCFQVPDTAFDQHKGVLMWNPNTNMSEDCLYLNVWAPSNRRYGEGQLRAVLVWIYGGGFYGGSATLDIYDARTLAAVNDIVIVSMQYRVGTIGFLHLGTGSAPGNMGLVDQHYALQWIYNNIESFGGDRHQVTLFGESAGSVSVSLHLLSPLSQNLFKYAIMQSGTALCDWGIESKAKATKRSRDVAEALGCDPDQPTNELVACLQQIDPSTIVNEMWYHQDDYNLITPILATVDGYFLTEHPAVSVKKGNFKKTSILLGGNKDEGSYFLIYALPYLYKRSRNKLMPQDDYMTVVEAVAHSDSKALIQAVNFEYKVPQNFIDDPHTHRDLLDDMIGDYDFLCPVVNFANRYAELGNPVYLYQFRHFTSANTWPRWMGVMHGYEIDHVFGHPLNESLDYTEEEKELSVRTMKYWTNFAKTG